MQPLDALTLYHFASELDLKLAGGKINRIQQPSHYDLLLHIWVGGEKGRQKLYINILPAFAFCTLLEDTRFLHFPEKPPNLCMVLRKHLNTARITQVRAIPDERVIEIHLDNFNELGQQVKYVLSMELMGKNSNIILYDAVDQTIIGCAHGVSEQMSRYREISVGYPYVPPPPPPHRLLRLATEQEFLRVVTEAQQTQRDPAQVLTQQYSGVGSATLRDLLERIPNLELAYRTLHQMFVGHQLYPAIHRDYTRYSLLPQHADDPEWQGFSSISAMIERFTRHHYLQYLIQQLKQQLRQVIRQQEKRLHKRKQQSEQADPEQITSLKKAGDLLTLAISQRQFPPPGSSQIELTDYETNQPLAIDLDPHLDLSENAQLYYKRYKKAQTRQSMVQQATEQLANQLAYMDELNHQVDTATSLDELEALKQELVSQGWIKPTETGKKGADKKESAPLAVQSSDGYTILIGKTGMQNELLVGKLAHPEDIWLHAHLIAGSHVLIKTQKQAVPDTTLLEAAQYAAYFSKARHSVNVPVVFTKARYVRKIPDSYPGHVNYTHEQAINVQPLAPHAPSQSPSDTRP